MYANCKVCQVVTVVIRTYVLVLKASKIVICYKHLLRNTSCEFYTAIQSRDCSIRACNGMYPDTHVYAFHLNQVRLHISTLESLDHPVCVCAQCEVVNTSLEMVGGSTTFSGDLYSHLSKPPQIKTC